MHFGQIIAIGIGAVGGTGCFLIFIWCIHAGLLAKAARSWPRIEGELEALEVERVSEDGGYAFRLKTRYSYEVNGKTYFARRASMLGSERGYSGYHSHVGWILDHVQASSPGPGRVWVYVDPKRSTRSCIVPGVGPWYTASMVMLPLLSAMFFTLATFAWLATP